MPNSKWTDKKNVSTNQPAAADIILPWIIINTDRNV